MLPRHPQLCLFSKSARSRLCFDVNLLSMSPPHTKRECLSRRHIFHSRPDTCASHEAEHSQRPVGRRQTITLLASTPVPPACPQSVFSDMHSRYISAGLEVLKLRDQAQRPGNTASEIQILEREEEVYNEGYRAETSDDGRLSSPLLPVLHCRDHHRLRILGRGRWRGA